jgi:hypothetical protein
MWKYICLLFVVFVSYVSSSSPVVATWEVTANGNPGSLIITNVDPYVLVFFPLHYLTFCSFFFFCCLFLFSAGDLTGTIFGNTIQGFFSADENKITFIRVTTPNIVADWQTFVGKRGRGGE